MRRLTFYESMPRDQEGNIKRAGRNDWSSRFGVSRDPLVDRQVDAYTICHKLIHALDFLLEFAVKLSK